MDEKILIYKEIKKFLTLPCEPKGNLNDYLKLCMKRYTDVGVSQNKYDELVKIFDEGRYKDFLMKEASVLDYKVVDEVIKNGYSTIFSSELVLNGILFSYEDKYYIPDDIIKYYKDKVTDKVKYKNCNDTFKFIVLNDIFIYGYAKVEDYEGYYLDNIKESDQEDIDDLFNTFEINNKKYYTFKFLNKDNIIPYVNENRFELTSIEKKYYIADIYDTLIDASELCSLKGNDLFFFVEDVCKDYNIDLVDDLIEKYNVKRKESDKLRKLIYSIDDCLRYWSYGGKTKLEKDVEDFILPSKPKSNKLSSLISSLDKYPKEILCENYIVDDISEVEDVLLDEFRAGMEGFEYLWNSRFFEKYQDAVYDTDVIDDEDVMEGIVFLYKDNDEIRMTFPDEIVKIATEHNTDENLNKKTKTLVTKMVVSQMLYLQGIVDRNSLYEKALENKAVESIDELDEIVSTVGRIVDDKYITNYNLDDLEIGVFWEDKKRCKYSKEVFDFDPNLENMNDSITEEVSEILNDANLNYWQRDYIISTLVVRLHTYRYYKEELDEINSEENYNLSKSIIDRIDSVCRHYKNIIPLWTSNGYSYNEMCELQKSKKVGRNDPCPCGSGKKYKKCCGS